MTIKKLSAIVIVSAALVSPALAQDTNLEGTGFKKPVHVQRHLRSVNNQVPSNDIYAPRAGWAAENYSYDHSRPGGLDADLNPTAN